MKNETDWNDVPVLTAAQLSEHIQKKTGIEAEKIRKTTDIFFDIILREIKEQDSFKLQGFGTFKKVFVGAAEGRNPRADTTIEIPAHYKVKFTPASALAGRINKPYARLKPKIIKEEVPAEPEPVRRQQAVQPEQTVLPAQPAFAVQHRDDFLQTAAEQTVFGTMQMPVPSPVQKKTVPEPVQIPPEHAAAAQTVQSQTVQHAVIEHQVIQQQIVQQQVIQNQQIMHQAADNQEEAYDPDYDDDDDDDIQKYISRCWFLAGVATVLTVIVLGFLVLALIRRPLPPQQKRQAPAAQSAPAARQKKNPVLPSRAVRIAADDNLYAGLAKAQYGVRNLWPYIYSANMLRYPDPDRPGAAKDLVLPPKPDASIDRKDIELSVIDVYDAYRTLISKAPKGRNADIRREHAVTALVCGETLYGGFIDRYAIRCEPSDVQAAREQIKKASQRQ